MRIGLATLALAAGLLGAGLGAPAAYALDETPRSPEQGGRAEPGGTRVDELMRALGLAVRSLPGYAPPEINERGDIVIRRRAAPAQRPLTPVRRIGPDQAEI